VLSDGIFERNPLFRNFESNGMVSGYGMRSPGQILENILRFRNSKITDRELDELMNPFSLGFFTSLVCEGAHRSLKAGDKSRKGVTIGKQIILKDLISSEIGEEGEKYYHA
jgi:hypothetical protein